MQSTNEDKAPPEETISVTIANRFDAFKEVNDSGVTRSNQIIAEIKCLTSNEAEHERTKQKLLDELKKMRKKEIIAELKAEHQKLTKLNVKLVKDLQEAKQQIEELKPDGINKASDSNEDT